MLKLQYLKYNRHSIVHKLKDPCMHHSYVCIPKLLQALANVRYYFWTGTYCPQPGYYGKYIFHIKQYLSNIITIHRSISTV